MNEALCDPREWAEAALVHDRAAVEERIPQRHEMGLLHGVAHHDQEAKLAIGVHDAKESDFWVRGHIPGRPLMPGVVMVEVAAQLCAWLGTWHFPPRENEFMGFGGIQEARFRGQVTPGDRMLVAAQIQRLRRNLATFRTQAWVESQLVYEGGIIGVFV